MRYFLIIISSVILSYSAYSQASGYLGKRFVLGVGYRMNPSIIYNLSYEEKNFYSSSEFSLNYVFSKTRSLGLRFSHFKSNNNGNHHYLGNSTSLNTDSYVSKSNGLGIEYKIYIADFIAPIGAYWQFSFDVYRTTSDDYMTGNEKEIFINYYGISSYNNLNTTNIALSLGVSRGKTFILYKTLGLDISVYTGITLNRYQLDYGAFGDIFSFVDLDYSDERGYIVSSFQRSTTYEIKRRLSIGLRIKMDLVL